MKFATLLTPSSVYMSRTPYLKAANRALGLVIAKNKEFGGLPFKTFSKLFDTMVWSVINYGAAVWGSR